MSSTCSPSPTDDCEEVKTGDTSIAGSREVQQADSSLKPDSTAAQSTASKASVPDNKQNRTAQHRSLKEEKRPQEATISQPIALAAIMDLPLDILHEIFKHVHPAVLLALSRANKALRYTLLHRGAKSTWEHSLKAATYPTIPSCIDNGMSLPQYVNLIYGKNCFSCGSTKGVSDFFLFLDKRCLDCMNSKYRRLLDWGMCGPPDFKTKYPGRTLDWQRVFNDWIAWDKLVDEKEFAEIEANLTTLSKGPVEDVEKYIDEVKARTQQAMNFDEAIHDVLDAEWSYRYMLHK
ncbi:hypothetical protein EV122DRAFT_274024 [Schizophyllum commune]